MRSTKRTERRQFRTFACFFFLIVAPRERLCRPEYYTLPFGTYLVRLQILALHRQRDICERFGVQQLIEHRQQIALVVVPSQAEPLRRCHCAGFVFAVVMEVLCTGFVRFDGWRRQRYDVILVPGAQKNGH